MKHSVKALQNGLARERERVKKLKKYDPVKMKTNLDDNKKQLEVAKAFKRPQALAPLRLITIPLYCIPHR